jgi:hypothetical protein
MQTNEAQKQEERERERGREGWRVRGMGSKVREMRGREEGVQGGWREEEG